MSVPSHNPLSMCTESVIHLVAVASKRLRTGFICVVLEANPRTMVTTVGVTDISSAV